MINHIIASIFVLAIGAIGIICIIADAIIPKIFGQAYAFASYIAGAGLVLFVITGATLSITLVVHAASGNLAANAAACNVPFWLCIRIRKFALEDEGIDCLAYLERISMANTANLSAEDLALLPKFKYCTEIINKITDGDPAINKIRFNIEKIHDIFVKFNFPLSKKELRKFYGTNPIEFIQAIDELYNILGTCRGEGISYIYNVAKNMIQ